MSSLPRKQQTQKGVTVACVGHLNGNGGHGAAAVFRSNNHIYAQVIDDEAQTPSVPPRPSTKTYAPARRSACCDASMPWGSWWPSGPWPKGIQQVVFDRVASCTTAGSRPLPMPPEKRAS